MKFNFKKIIAIVMAVLMVASLMAGCGAPKNMTTVLADGYGKKPLESALRAYVEQQKDNDTNVSYKWENGWNGPGANPDIYLGDKEKAISLVLTIVAEDEDGDTQSRMAVIYFAYNKKFNVVRYCGGYTQSAKEGISTGSTYGYLSRFYEALEAEEDDDNGKESYGEEYYEDDDNDEYYGEEYYEDDDNDEYYGYTESEIEEIEEWWSESAEY